MSSTVRSQLKRVKALTLQIRPHKQWVFVVEEGDRPTTEQMADVREGDTLLIRQIPRNWLQ